MKAGGTAERPQYHRVECESLTFERLVKFFIDSFKFSQGSPSLQELFFIWANQNGYFCEEELEKFRTPEYEKRLLKIVRLPKRHSRLKKSEVKEEFLVEWRLLLSFPGAKNNFSLSILEMSILLKILDEDSDYLDKKSRPNRQTEKNVPKVDKTDTILDPHASQVRKYILEPQNVSDPIFKALFEKLRNIIITILSEQNNFNRDHREINRLLSEVIYYWEKSHVGQKFFASDFPS